MKLIKWNPFFDFSLFDEGMENFLKNFPKAGQGVFSPSIDIYQKDKNVIVEMSAPGMEADKLDISIDDNNVLIVKGKTQKKTEVDENDYYKKEISYGTFYRSVALPANVAKDKAAAEYEDGLLKISVPVSGESKTKTVKVTVKKAKKIKK